jgi:small subunit ribosomal protein S9
MEEYLGTGRRKKAVASVRMRRGKGEIVVNNRKMEEYFPIAEQQGAVLAPFKLIGDNKGFDLLVKTSGGGINGQSIALRLAIARALSKLDEKLQPELKELGYLTRDPRRREREKYGQPGARKRFQFAKR